MKIALVGTHGVGKSTTLKDIGHSNSITEIARELILQGHKQGDLGFQELVFREQNRREKQNNNFVADRGVRDILAYTRYYSEELYQTLLPKATNQYDKIFMIPIQFGMEKDGVRIDNVQYQIAIQDMLFRVLHENEVEYSMLTGDRESRKQQVFDFIEKDTKKRLDEIKSLGYDRVAQEIEKQITNGLGIIDSNNIASDELQYCKHLNLLINTIV